MITTILVVSIVLVGILVGILAVANRSNLHICKMRAKEIVALELKIELYQDKLKENKIFYYASGTIEEMKEERLVNKIITKLNK